MTYYNDSDPVLIEWLDALIRAGHLPVGVLDGRSIVHVRGDDLRPFRDVHLFAGIGGWPHALRLAGWPAARPVWTCSCPCQPFSCAGKRKGAEDKRHLWPEAFRLIGECLPATVFGEQVASKDGREWLAGVFADLEGLGYAVAGADLCAAGVGAPHIRQRLYWVADAGRLRVSGRGKSGDVASTTGVTEGEEDERERLRDAAGDGGTNGWMVHPESNGRVKGRTESDGRNAGSTSTHGRMGQPVESGLQGLGNGVREEPKHRSGSQPPGPPGGCTDWSDFDLVPCFDGKTRRVKSGLHPLAHGLPGRMAQLRGLGNAIVPQVAAEFVKAFLETEHDHDD